MYHAVRLSIGNKLFHAPLRDPTCVLDIGTGTGESAVHSIILSTNKSQGYGPLNSVSMSSPLDELPTLTLNSSRYLPCCRRYEHSPYDHPPGGFLFPLRT